MEEHLLTVRRRARYLTLGPLEQPVTQIWMACHGYSQLARAFAKWLRALDDGARLVVVPEGLSRFYLGDGGGTMGASWMTRELREQEIADYVDYLDAVYADVTDRARRTAGCTLHALGFSQGAATAARWATLGTPRVHELVLWAGDVPPDLDFPRAAERLDGADVRLVLGTRDEYAGDAFLAKQTALLDRHGIRHTVHRFDGGHRLDDDTLRELAG